MTRNKWGLLVVALVLGFVFSSNAAEFHISGNVVDQDGTPVAGAIVNARTRDGQNTISVITDETGSFAIPSQIDREVTAWKKGYRRSEPQAATRENASKVGIKLVSVPVVPVSELTSSDILPYLPEDPNWQAFITGCSACHGYSTVIAHPRSRDEWLQTVTRMQSILYDSGFKGNPRECEDLSLAKNTPIGLRIGLRFQFDTFNAFNIPQFGIPQRLIDGARFGKIFSAGRAKTTPSISQSVALRVDSVGILGVVPVRKIRAVSGFEAFGTKRES